ncbi:MULTISPECIES: flavodoxin family protein [unclassified Mycobacterium]|uniref:flavodoxin family protein n=1 Tax=unclassified Mycobacterium TaxID=2642494 RepID=UPI0008007B73|nr:MULTISPECIES: NAD(P)H-dependent oxidoreductase [unclassified Mycobacterium]OBG72427.1 flavodoxin [Mycobacterium sp. E1214]OBH22560.1 flavodoxin [Mycobacterium sp. E1319]
MTSPATSATAPSLRALALTCSLKKSPTPSSSDLIADQLLAELGKAGVEGAKQRCVDLALLPGTEADMGPGDEWPALLDRIKRADILVLSTPTWVGHMSSVAQRVLERLDAELSDKDNAGRPVMVGKVAVAAVVGNEDGAHKIVADLFQALNDIGFSIAAQGCTYWNGEAMQGTNFNDLDEVPEAVAGVTATAARNAVHLAGLLRHQPYPPYE